MSPNMSSRSSSHASNRNDEPLLPFGASGLGFDKPSLQMRIRSVLSRNLVRRVLLWVVASLVLVSIILYSKTPVSLYDVATTHHQGQSESPGEGHPVGDQVEPESPGHANVESPGDDDKPDESEKTEPSEAPEQPEQSQAAQEPQEPQDPQPDQADDKDDDETSEPDKQGAVVVEVPGDEEEDHQDDDDGNSLSPEDKEAKKQYQEDLKRNPWLKFKQLVSPYAKFPFVLR